MLHNLQNIKYLKLEKQISTAKESLDNILIATTFLKDIDIESMLGNITVYSPLSSGIIYTELKKDNLWDKYYTNAPPQHKCPTTTHRIRTEIQQSKESVTVF